jgi:acetyltransferase
VVAQIARLTESEARAQIDQFVALLSDVVNAGSSVGFLRPMDATIARDYWNEVLGGVRQGSKILLAARIEGEIVGSAQLELAGRPNGIQRAEVQKVIVLSRFRRRGIARDLMAAIEREARAAARSVLVLDTEVGAGAEPFYESLGWQRVGSIPNFALNTDGIPTPNMIYFKLI